MSCTSNIVWLSVPLHGRLPPFSQQPTVHGSHYPCAWTRSEHPDLGPIIPTLLSRNIFVGIGIIDPIHSRFVPDGLPTETTCRSFSHFVGPICGLADLVEEWPYNGHDVVVNKGASHDTAIWEHSSCLSLRSFRSKAAAPSLYNFVLTAPCCPLTRASTRIDPGMSAGLHVVLHLLFHHARSESSIPMLAQSNKAICCMPLCSPSLRCPTSPRTLARSRSRQPCHVRPLTRLASGSHISPLVIDMATSPSQVSSLFTDVLPSSTRPNLVIGTSSPRMGLFAWISI
ncbi:hypothetical protein EDB89DRAFT_2010802 [Lactarius sanguifluus]|nr:hypothetical protein EDB89DRAFT_2010802 [Lactarius sanguifluus]